MRKTFTLLSIFLITIQVSVKAQDRIYWGIPRNNISSAKFDGTDVKKSVTLTGQIFDMETDFYKGILYWGDGSIVKKANTDGTNLQKLYEGSKNIGGVALDLINNKLYFSEYGSGNVIIRRCNLDGTGMEVIVTSSNSNFYTYNLTISTTLQKLYWTESASSGANANSIIMRCNLDGTNVETVKTTTSFIPGLAIDEKNQRLYLAYYYDNKVMTTDMTCSTTPTLVFDSSNGTFQMAVSNVENKLYFGEMNSKKIRKCNLDGSSPQDIVSGLSAQPMALSIPTIPLAPTISANETYTFELNDFLFSSVDKDLLTKIKITTLTSKGTLYLDANNNNIVDAGEAVVLNQEIAKADLVAGTLKFNPAANEYGSPYTTFTFRWFNGTSYSTLDLLQYIYVLSIAPTVTTQAVSEIGLTTATGNGNVTNLGVPSPTSYGVCWNTAGSPTTSNSKVDLGATSATGAFTAAMTGLTANTTYKVRAYATNEAGTSYGTEVSFTTAPPPVVTGISPTSGSTEGGTTVTITGTNLTDATAVKFGSTNATSFTVNSVTQITAISPAGSAGAVDVTVTTAGGTSATSASDQFTYVIPEAQWGLAGTDGAAPSSWVSSGTLADAMSYANGLSSGTAYIQLLSDVATTYPLDFATGKTTILDLNGKTIDRGLTEVTFFGGNVITVNGTLTLKDGSTTTVASQGKITGGYNSNIGGGIYINGGSFTMQGGNITGNRTTNESIGGGGVCVNPTGNFTMQDGSITNNEALGWGGGVYAQGSFVVTGGRITGNKSQNGGVYFDNALTVGGTAVIDNNQRTGPRPGECNVYINAYKTITVSASTPLTTGASIGVTTAFVPESGSPVNVTGDNSADYSSYFTSDRGCYTRNSGSGSAQVVQHAVALFPTVTSISPTSGSTLGGTTVTITGTSLTAATEVKFGSINATSFEVNSATQITAVSPAVSAGAVDITVTTAEGTSATSSADQFVYLQPQVITFNALSTHIYGDASFTLAATGGASGNPVVFTSSDETVATCTGTNGSTITLLKAGHCTITANQAGNVSYDAATPVSQTLTVNALPVTVTVNAGQSKLYGESDPALTYSVSPALKAGDAFTGALARAAGEDVGTYAINQGTLSAGSNYALTFVGNDFVIKPKTIAITVTVNAGQSKVYGDADPVLTYSVSPALKAGDTFTGALVREAGENVGNYTISQGTLSAGSNYIISFESNKLAITPKQLTTTTPSVAKIKLYDGITKAQITSLGALTGAVASDTQNLSLSGEANYNDASVGNNKSITVVYALGGSAASNYLVPASYVIQGASIQDKITLATLSAPASSCQGDDVLLNYQLLSGTPDTYTLTFGNQALSAGFSNKENIPVTGSSATGYIVIKVPSGIAGGTYTANLKMKGILGNESPSYPFTFTINLSTDYLITKFNSVILFDNASNRFNSFQWYKNGQPIAGATKQFYNDPEGLSGTYYVAVTTTAGEKLRTCDKIIVRTTPTKPKISVYPNPVKRNQTTAITFSGIEDEKIESAKLIVYKINGEKVYVNEHISKSVQLRLNLPTGIYVGNVITSDKEVYSFKVVIE